MIVGWPLDNEYRCITSMMASTALVPRPRLASIRKLDSGLTKQVRAQLKAVTGDKKGALADLALVAKEFASRGVTVEDQIKQLRLKRLLA